MSKPDWKAFSRLTWTADILPVLDALGVVDEEIPEHGRPRRFQAVPLRWGGMDRRIVNIGEDNVFVGFNGVGSRQFGSGDDVLKFLDLRRGYSNDKALRRWLALWGWRDPKAAKAAADAPTAEPMVI